MDTIVVPTRSVNIGNVVDFGEPKPSSRQDLA